MNIGLIGLGKMGYNLALNMVDHKYSVTAFDINESAVKEISHKNVTGVNTIEDLVKNLPTPRVIWLMVPAGEVTENVCAK